MSDLFFRELLGVGARAGLQEIKRAFHRLARENHPDLFPEERRDLQQLKMIMLNEAYAALCGRAGEGGRSGREPPGEAAAGRAAGEPAGPGRAWGEGPTTEPGPHRDPAYAYYKQGFVHFSRALHGIEALYQSIAPQKGTFSPRIDAYQRFAGSLVTLRRSYGYFQRVVDEFPDSIWSEDARLKLRRIERFSDLYRRIVGNLGGSAPQPER